MRRFMLLGGLIWIGRWLALEIASQVARKRPRGPAPKDSPRPPGWMPGPNPYE
jgi:hypothetical protein